MNEELEKLKVIVKHQATKIANQKKSLDQYRESATKSKARMVAAQKLNEFFKDRLLKLYGKEVFDKVFNTVEKPEELESPLVKVIKALRAENEELRTKLEIAEK